jgi:lipoprotein-anchoring transpeptidase ErfK/SrfK
MRAIGVSIAFAGIVFGGTFSIDPALLNSNRQPDVLQGGRGAAVLRAQILLSRADFSPGELDANFGSNMVKALSAFQSERKIPITGALDGATWGALNADTAPILTRYTITPEDLAGPFRPIPKNIMEQANLPDLGYGSPLEMLGEKFHSSPEVVAALNPGAEFDKPGQQLTAPNLATTGLPPAARVVVSKSESSVRAYDDTGKLLVFYAATIGSIHDPLPIGEWKIRGVARNPKFHYNAALFWDAKDPNSKAILPPGPNSPVGVVWIDLSKEHYGIHGTPEPGRIGHTESHGCIRLTNWDALELASIVRPGLPVTFKE